MSESQQKDGHPAPHDRISPEHSEQIRQLSHDLSNALEVILQTSYLLGITPAGEDSTKWREMLDKGVASAESINRRLRDYIRANS
jgi:hypothetical protein